MPLLEYILLGVLGVLICHYFSGFYSKKNNIIAFLGYLFILGNLGGQHYNVLFNKEFIDNWLFFIETNNSYYTDTYRFVAMLFLFLTTLTLPPSKFGKLFKRISRRS
ncbi:hypothetical protein I2706_002004 [Vibrio alginolyticus]|nr:hypothetical protein [Vibrio alginolyticus]